MSSVLLHKLPAHTNRQQILIIQQLTGKIIICPAANAAKRLPASPSDLKQPV